MSYEDRRQNGYSDRDESAARDQQYGVLWEYKDALEAKVAQWFIDWQVLRDQTTIGAEIGDLNQLRADFISEISGALGP